MWSNSIEIFLRLLNILNGFELQIFYRKNMEHNYH